MVSAHPPGGARRSRWVPELAIVAALMMLQAALVGHVHVVVRGPHAPLSLGLELAWRHVPTGFQNLLADTLWLRVLQHVGGQLGRDEPLNVTGVKQALDLAIDLDPAFHAPVEYGAWIIADGHDPAGALDFLAHARRQHPDDWLLPYHQAFIEFLYRKRYDDAARLFSLAASMPGAPPRVMNMVAGMYTKGKLKDKAIETWWGIHQANRGPLRAIAARNLRALGVRVPD
jgi:hypothetical protein